MDERPADNSFTRADDLIQELVAQGSESKVDYKGPMRFPTDNKGRAEIARDVIGWSNSRDGGYLLIGVEDMTYEAIGLSDTDAKTWDQANVTESIGAFASPAPSVEIFRGNSNGGALLVCVRIVPFQDQPLVCIRDQQALDKKFITRRGALYVRTHGTQTKEITTQDELRQLLDWAYTKKSEHLLGQIKDLIDAHWPGGEASDVESALSSINVAMSDMENP
jgi:predicted HTH transcriptional regulator